MRLTDAATCWRDDDEPMRALLWRETARHGAVRPIHPSIRSATLTPMLLPPLIAPLLPLTHAFAVRATPAAAGAILLIFAVYMSARFERRGALAYTSLPMRTRACALSTQTATAAAREGKPKRYGVVFDALSSRRCKRRAARSVTSAQRAPTRCASAVDARTSCRRCRAPAGRRADKTQERSDPSIRYIAHSDGSVVALNHAAPRASRYACRR